MRRGLLTPTSGKGRSGADGAGLLRPRRRVFTGGSNEKVFEGVEGFGLGVCGAVGGHGAVALWNGDLVLTARIRPFGVTIWTYVSVNGPSERRLLNDWLNYWREREDAPDYHLQEWDEETEEWFDPY